MTDEELDRMMRRVLLDASAREEEKQEEPPAFIPSRQHLAQMKAMKRDPLGWARNKARPVWRRALRQAAAVALVLSLGFGAAMAASPNIRAWVARWTAEWNRGTLEFTYSGDDRPKEMPLYEITALPEGFSEDVDRRFVTLGQIARVYTNDHGDIIDLHYLYMTQGALMDINPLDDEMSEITVNGMKGLLFVPKDPESMTLVTWIDEKANLHFSLRAALSPEEILKLAESVALQKK